ncbi:hypothetical protein EUA93_05700 [Nocardioides oleivorans]|uniref:DUF6199 domain-containing protein n=1 Tax=Nocardioides oleivorans TaxID=273676 RepID=A0A4V1RKY4_9ACTN|nr:DUF6199 family natural product biosynthesis protein [Nocardioides oleivorans]RYB93892.1 hypothetical protein EUA93_05700 [Nocardioides oleivorans]
MVAVLWIVALLLLVLTVVNPRQLWYATTAWQFKNPQANEPSEASFALGRVVSGIAALGFGIAALVTTVGSVGPLSQERLDSVGSAAARDLTGEYGKYGSPGVAAIEDAIGRDDVEVREGRTVNEDAPFGESYGIEEYYELEGVEDDSIRGCIEIAYDGGLFHDGDIDVDATYSTGAC